MEQYNFPDITKIEIKNFSLFKKTQHISIDIDKKVFCLAGANGLGKSTFVTIINYALTGIVKKADADFAWYRSIPEFYSKSKSFAAEYFDGKVTESDRDLAEVTLHFNVGEASCKVTRGFFEPDELRCFEKTVNGSSVKLPKNLTPAELNEEYEKNLANDIGLSGFDQFVFLQIFVLTFDETHQLLFWNNNIMERVLHLFFGLDPSKAKLADQLRKDVSKYDSNAKNIQWNITKARNELRNIIDQQKNSGKSKESEDELKIYEDHKKLTEELDELFNKSESISDDLRDIETIIADYSIRISALKSEYDLIFNRSNPDETPIERNNEIIDVLNELKAKIFSGEDYQPALDRLVKIIQELKQNHPEGDNVKFLEKLKEIDEKLFKLKTEAKNAQDRKNRLIEDEKSISVAISEAKEKITQIEKDNSDLIKKLNRPKTQDGLSSLIDSYKNQIDRYVKQKEKNIKKRDQKKNELKPLEKELSLQYNQAESEFIPIFNSYAKSFLGLNIDIQLSITSKAVFFKLDINDSQRKKSHQLSESQRYFIDIALRMALIQLGARNCTLLVDTPEGSLDIAYESRAGRMFADFSKKEYSLILTANINTSQLLLQLAKMCKDSGMHIERMTEWTTLSDVQQQEEDFIENAYLKIEEALT
ncbi:MAG: AAA family ATPase [Thermodesulfobacteriota bacterium]|nr:AAA family ATPase [Thermodesulfobacteriota bacterium]